MFGDMISTTTSWPALILAYYWKLLRSCWQYSFFSCQLSWEVNMLSAARAGKAYEAFIAQMCVPRHGDFRAATCVLMAMLLLWRNRWFARVVFKEAHICEQNIHAELKWWRFKALNRLTKQLSFEIPSDIWRSPWPDNHHELEAVGGEFWAASLDITEKSGN